MKLGKYRLYFISCYLRKCLENNVLQLKCIYSRKQPHQKQTIGRLNLSNVPLKTSLAKVESCPNCFDCVMTHFGCLQYFPSFKISLEYAFPTRPKSRVIFGEWLHMWAKIGLKINCLQFNRYISPMVSQNRGIRE